MDGLQRMGTLCKASVHNYMSTKGCAEEEALNSQEEKMPHSLEACQSFSPARIMCSVVMTVGMR